MGTIAQKLEYLNDTRLLLKDNINKINNVLDDNSTFRSYPQELFNGYLDILNNGTDTLWSNLEKVSQTGTEAVLEGVETAPIKMVLNGNTSQDTTSGIQLFDISKVVTNWNDGKGVKNNNDGTLTVHPPTTSSSTSASSPNTLKDYCPTLQVGDVVYLNATTTGTSKYIYLLTSASVWVFKSARTITQNDLDSRVLWYASGNDTEATISDIIISKTNTTIWEKYTGGQPSPSPDYPQEVKVVSGDNEIKVGQNIWNYNGTNYEQGFYNSIGGFISRSDYRCFTYDCKQGDLFERTGAGFAGIVTFWNNSTFISSQNFDLVTPKGIVQVPQNANKAKIAGTNTSSSSWIRKNPINYQVNLGNTELCKIGDYQDYLYKNNGKWYVHKEIGKVVLDGDNKRVAYSNVYNNIYQFYYLVSSVLTNYNQNAIYVFTNFFKGVVWSQNWTIDNSSALQNNGNLRLNTSKFDNANDFNLWLTTHNLIVYYVLATPTETEITDTTLIEQLEAISKAKSVKDKTYITQTNDDLPFILDVEAIKEYEVN